MNINDELKKIGLTKSEISIYIYLLSMGVSTPPQISKGTKIARTNTYHVLRSLVERGLIDTQKKGKRKEFLARNPDVLVKALESQKKVMEKILPNLHGLYKVQANQPIFRFYNGLDEILEIFDQTLVAQEILGIVSTQKLFALAPNYFFKKYQPAIKKRGIMFRDIITYASGEESGKQAQQAMPGLYSYCLLPGNYGNVPADILIWDKQIALITLVDPIIGTVLDSAVLADMFRMVFEMLWQSLVQKK